MSDIEKLGRYDIVRVLGKGAMGVVYEGRDPNLERKVAIKTSTFMHGAVTRRSTPIYSGQPNKSMINIILI